MRQYEIAVWSVGPVAELPRKLERQIIDASNVQYALRLGAMGLVLHKGQEVQLRIRDLGPKPRAPRSRA